MKKFLNPVFLAVAMSHFAVDILNGQRSVLFTFLSEPLGFSNKQLGLLTTAYIVIAAVMQPVFGYLTDRTGPRWVISGGVLWIGLFYSIGLMTPGVNGLVFLVIASLGSGAFHPAGTMQATRSGEGGRETTSTSIFFVFGQTGLFLGPLIAGQVLQQSGTRGLLAVTALALPVGVFAVWALRNTTAQAPPNLKEKPPGHQVVQSGVWVLVTLAVLAASQSWAQENIRTFMPKYLSDLGQTAAVYGQVTALFMGGSAIGNVFGGGLADRFGKRRVAGIALTLGAIPFFIISVIGWSPWLYALIPLAGALTGSTHSILVVLAQRLIPGGMALASGLTLGFMFASGALGALVSGVIADTWGFPAMFQFTVGLVLVAAALTKTLPKT